MARELPAVVANPSSAPISTPDFDLARSGEQQARAELAVPPHPFRWRGRRGGD